MRFGANADQRGLEANRFDLSVRSGYRNLVSAREPRKPFSEFDAIATKLVFEDINLMIERLLEPMFQVISCDVVFDLIGTAIESSFAPA